MSSNESRGPVSSAFPAATVVQRRVEDTWIKHEATRVPLREIFPVEQEPLLTAPNFGTDF